MIVHMRSELIRLVACPMEQFESLLTFFTLSRVGLCFLAAWFLNQSQVGWTSNLIPRHYLTLFLSVRTVHQKYMGFMSDRVNYSVVEAIDHLPISRMDCGVL